MRGGRRLEGEVVLSGAKNSALKLLAASLLTTDPCVIRRVPRITDVATMVTMLRALGADVGRRGRPSCSVRAGDGLSGCAPYELVRTMRASIIVMGPLVARLGEATIAMPGGCNIGPRRIDFHIRGLEKLGRAHRHRPRLHPRAQHRPAGAPSSRSTTPAWAPPRTSSWRPRPPRARRSSRTPPASPRSWTSARSSAAWAPRSRAPAPAPIRIAGGRPLHGVDHAVIADRIEAGTYLLMGAATGGRVTTVGLDPAHLELFLDQAAGHGRARRGGRAAHHRGA